MKVYAVVGQYRDIDGDWVDGEIIRLFTTKDAAKKYNEQHVRYGYVKEMTVYEEDK